MHTGTSNFFYIFQEENASGLAEEIKKRKKRVYSSPNNSAAGKLFSIVPLATR
jgi:hypothetical protein